MYRFIESIKVEDREIFLADLHQKRVNETLANFEGRGRLSVSEIFRDLQIEDNGLFKLRIVYDLNANFTTQLIPYAISEIHDFQLVENNSFDYSFKFEDRKEFEKMKTAAKTEEIIIVKNNHITDTSFSNLLFLKDKHWYTPSTYLLNGVQRQHLLAEKQIREAEITLHNLRDFTHFQLINSMNDFDDMFIYPVSKIRNLPNFSETIDL